MGLLRPNPGHHHNQVALSPANCNSHCRLVFNPLICESMDSRKLGGIAEITISNLSCLKGISQPIDKSRSGVGARLVHVCCVKMEAITVNQLHSMANAMTGTCDHIVLMLRNIEEQWHEAPYFLTSIMESCQNLDETISQFRDHLHDEMGLPCDVLHSILTSFQEVLNWVEKGTRDIQLRGNDAADRDLWKRFRQEVPDSTLKNCSSELDKQNSSIESLMKILKL